MRTRERGGRAQSRDTEFGDLSPRIPQMWLNPSPRSSVAHFRDAGDKENKHCLCLLHCLPVNLFIQSFVLQTLPVYHSCFCLSGTFKDDKDMAHTLKGLI